MSTSVGDLPARIADLKRLLDERAARLGRTVRLMEVCGTHTMQLFRSGIRAMLPPNVKLLSGPGCPVCVTPMGVIEAAIEIAGLDDVVLATFGDMVRVPGSRTSLERAKAEGADVRVVYSPLDALKLAEAEPGRRVVFFAIGFETTSPTVAATAAYARDRELANFLLLVAHKLIPPAMVAILEGGEAHVDGFLCPGHVCVTIGSVPFEPIAERYQAPCVVTGFEAEDILEGVAMVLLQLVEERPSVEIQYKRWVRTSAGSTARATARRRGPSPRSSRSATPPGAASASSPTAASRSSPSSRDSTPSPRSASSRRRSSRTPAAPAATCSAASSTRPTAPSSRPLAPRPAPSAHAWSRPRAVARRSTSTEGMRDA